MRNTATPRTVPPPIPRFRRTSPATPSNTRSPARFPPANAWSAMFIPAPTWSPHTSASPGGTTKSTATKCTRLKTTQFADFHGHGWVFRAVYKHDRKGNWLDKDGQEIAFDDPQRFQKAVHLTDIHLEKGMQCVDCHFAQDNHGTGKIYGEPRAAVEIDCVDCHGTIRQKATLVTSGPAAPEKPPGGSRGRSLETLRTPWGLRRFEWRGDRLIQRSMTNENAEWEVVQTKDT